MNLSGKHLRTFTGLALAVLLFSPCADAEKPILKTSGGQVHPSKRAKPDAPPDKAGPENTPDPLTTTAEERFEETQRQINQQQAEAASQLNGGQSAGCTGLFCLGSLTNAQTAAAAAQAIATAASQMQAQAAQQRNDILQTVNAGAQSGRFPISSVARMHQLFKSEPRPNENQIQSLDPKLHDAATALKINQDEHDFLNETKNKFAQTAKTARDFEQTLQANRDRGTTLNQPVAKGRGNAKYPSLAKGAKTSSPGAGEGAPSNITGRSTEDLESGRSASLGKPVNGDLAITAGGPSAPGGSAGGKNLEGKDNNVSAKNGPAAGGKKPEGEGENKQLSADAKAMLAGMLKELKDDIAKGSGSDTKTPMEITDASGKKVVLDHVPSGSALEGMLLTMETKGPRRQPASSPAAIFAKVSPGAAQFSDMDFFGVDKSLFVRVRDYLRVRGQRDEDFAGR